MGLKFRSTGLDCSNQIINAHFLFFGGCVGSG